MTGETENKGIFNNNGGILQAKKLISTIMVIGAAIVFGMLFAPARVQAQRLCEHNDNPVATIDPCFGPTGTTVTITPGKSLASAPDKLVFKRVLANGVPTQVVTQIASSNTATSPPQLCAKGNGRWEAWLVLADGKSQGKIGAFWSDGCTGGNSSGLGANPSGNNGNNNSSKETVVLPPITMNVDTAIYAKTKSTSQSYIKNITSSRPEVATATEWGTNEIQINARKTGVTTIRFLDANTGTNYQVTVTVNAKPKPFEGGDGQGEIGKIDPCLVGEWETATVSGSVKGGNGFRLTIKNGGTQIVDYSLMQILTLQDLTYRYGGAVEGILVTENGIAKNVSIKKAGATLAMGNQDGEGPVKSIADMGPGALGINKNDNSYSCTDKTLKFITEDYRGKVFLQITMKRLKK